MTRRFLDLSPKEREAFIEAKRREFLELLMRDPKLFAAPTQGEPVPTGSHQKKAARGILSLRRRPAS